MYPKIVKLVLGTAALVLTFPAALAYIDPGTGSMIIGSIGPIISLVLAAIGAFFMTRFINPIKKFYKEHTAWFVIVLVGIIGILISVLFLIV